MKLGLEYSTSAEVQLRGDHGYLLMSVVFLEPQQQEAYARLMQLNVGGVRLIKVLYGYKVHVAAALTLQKHDVCKAVKHLRTRELDLPAYKVFALAQTPTSLIDGVCCSIDYHMGACSRGFWFLTSPISGFHH